MCHCCGCYHQYSPYQSYGMTYGYPYAGYYYPYYGMPLGYAYANLCAPVTYPATVAATPVAPVAVAPSYPRGEYRVGNCLMICQ